MSRAQVVGAAAVAVVLVGAVAAALIARSGSSGGHRRVAAAPTTASTSPPTASSTSSPAVSSSTTATTTTTAPTPSSRRLYPASLPSGVGSGALWIYANPKMDSGYTQSYYGAPSAAELIIGERPARVGGEPTAPAKFAGRDVLMWHSHDSNNPVIVVTAKLSGRDVTLVSYGLSDADLAAVLNGLQPRANGRGWETGVLPAGLRLFGEGDQTPEPSDVYYILEFGPFNQAVVSVSVHPGALLPEDTCICNPGMRRSLKTTTINGKPAVVIDRSDTDSPGQAFEVDWQYAPDIVAGVSVYRYDENTAIQIASSLAPADPATWAALRCVNSAGVTVACSSEPQVPTSG